MVSRSRPRSRLKEATRIKVDGANITEVFGNIYSSNCGGVAAVNRDTGPSLAAINPTGEIVLECDKDKGEIYVKPVVCRRQTRSTSSSRQPSRPTR